MARLQEYNPVGLTQLDDLQEVVVKNLNAISISIKTSQSEIAGNTQKIEDNAKKIEDNFTSIEEAKNSVSVNEGRSSRSEIFLVSDVTPVLTPPGIGLIAIDVAGNNILINKIPLGGGTSLDLTGLKRIQLFGNNALATVMIDVTVVDNTTYYGITSSGATGSGIYSLSDLLNVTFHWQ